MILQSLFGLLLYWFPSLLIADDDMLLLEEENHVFLVVLWGWQPLPLYMLHPPFRLLLLVILDLFFLKLIYVFL